mmetsp:Transcript_19579/g.49940  ORF Transcript_19579/g.49940 Transcript_19579/m.49940 type:complete len:294 (-) Transcript_19579:416-1297(-)
MLQSTQDTKCMKVARILRSQSCTCRMVAVNVRNAWVADATRCTNTSRCRRVDQAGCKSSIDGWQPGQQFHMWRWTAWMPRIERIGQCRASAVDQLKRKIVVERSHLDAIISLASQDRAGTCGQVAPDINARLHGQSLKASSCIPPNTRAWREPHPHLANRAGSGIRMAGKIDAIDAHDFYPRVIWQARIPKALWCAARGMLDKKTWEPDTIGIILIMRKLKEARIVVTTVVSARISSNERDVQHCIFDGHPQESWADYRPGTSSPGHNKGRPSWHKVPKEAKQVEVDKSGRVV